MNLGMTNVNLNQLDHSPGLASLSHNLGMADERVSNVLNDMIEHDRFVEKEVPKMRQEIDLLRTALQKAQTENEKTRRENKLLQREVYYSTWLLIY
jgi:hypothetical protein